MLLNDVQTEEHNLPPKEKIFLQQYLPDLQVFRIMYKF